MLGPVVIMGVAGCGKSSLAAMLAAATGARLIEGDDYHSPTNREKMSRGIPLTDTDREGWLATLGDLLGKVDEPTILACSALKKTYRDRLRAAVPGLRFIFLEIDPQECARRVESRGAGHFMPASLVDSQFATLESPVAETGVLRLDAHLPAAQLSELAARWLARGEER